MTGSNSKKKYTFKQARLQKGLTQEALAQRLEVNTKTYISWETGKTQLKSFHLFAVAGALNMNPNEITV